MTFSAPDVRLVSESSLRSHCPAQPPATAPHRQEPSPLTSGPTFPVLPSASRALGSRLAEVPSPLPVHSHRQAYVHPVPSTSLPSPRCQSETSGVSKLKGLGSWGDESGGYHLLSGGSCHSDGPQHTAWNHDSPIFPAVKRSQVT